MPSIKKTLLILEFIRWYIRKYRMAPTIREIGEQFHMRSSASVHRHLCILQCRGWIRRERYAMRGIEIVEQEKRAA